MIPFEVALRFMDRINAGDIEGMIALMTDDHRFIDSLGVKYVGRARMRDGWEQYFRMVPDYRIDILETFGEGQTVILVGVARGTYTGHGELSAKNAWETPGVWRAQIEGEFVASCQVYADNEPIRQRIAESSA